MTKPRLAYDIDGVRLYETDVMAGLRALPDNSAQCVVTSPPYWRLRDYGVKGMLGLEATPEQYLRRIVRVFRELRRVLRHDGTLWLNVGDTYNSNAGMCTRSQTGKHGYWTNDAINRRVNHPTLKAKDLCGMPWRIALALQADGWWLRRDIIWDKPNCMPESATDRPTTSHEYLFLLTKRARYFYDGHAVREANESGPSDLTKMAEGLDRIGGKTLDNFDPLEKATALTNIGRKRAVGSPYGRNLRSVWRIATTPSALPHFAMFPDELAEKCIRAGTSEAGCCARCGAPWKRIVEPSEAYAQKLGHSFIDHTKDLAEGMSQLKQEWFTSVSAEYISRGFRPGCKHDAVAVPCVVLDPFAGMATTLKVARTLGRHAVGMELSPKYVKKAVQRLRYGSRGVVAIGKGQLELDEIAV